MVGWSVLKSSKLSQNGRFQTLRLQKVRSFQHGFVCLSFPHPTLLMVEYSIGNSIYFSLWSIFLLNRLLPKGPGFNVHEIKANLLIYIHTYILTYIFTSENLWAQATQAGHIRNLNLCAVKPGGFLAIDVIVIS